MSSYDLKLKIIRDEFNSIRADVNYFELNSKAKQIVDDIVELTEENMLVLQKLSDDILNINPDATYYTKEAIDDRIEALNDAKLMIQIKLLNNAKDIGTSKIRINKLVKRLDDQTELFSNFREKVLSDLKLLKQQIKDNGVFAEQSFDYTAELIRQTMNTGVVSVNQTGTTFPKIRNQPIDTAYSMLNIHNHPNYSRMPGMGWFEFQANGFMGQTRHNDYRLNKQSIGLLETVPNEAPEVPNYHYSVSNMQSLFQRYIDGTLDLTEKDYFRWDMTYLECYWVEVDSLDDTVSDTFESFRHSFGNQTPTSLAYRFLKSRADGKKARFENIPNFPSAKRFVDSKGNTKYAVFAYRIITAPLEQFNGKRWNEIMEQKQDILNSQKFGSVSDLSVRSKFEFKNMKEFDSAIQNIPAVGGLSEGLSEKINEFKTIDGNHVMEPANKARYHRTYTMGSDAVGRGSYTNGWNDPTLIVGYTKEESIADGVSYMIPLEMLLRTPLESWNPDDLEIVSSISGNGTLSNPFNGFKENKYNYHTPSNFYKGYGNVDPADTGTGIKAVKNVRGDVGKYVASGIYYVLPDIAKVSERIRLRFPIHWTADEFSPSNIRLEAYKNKNKAINAMLMSKTLDQAIRLGSKK